MLIGILKCIFLVLGIVYGTSNLVKILFGFRRGGSQKITATQFFLMAIGIVGFLALQFNWLGL
jgi:fatty acid desaturase